MEMTRGEVRLGLVERLPDLREPCCQVHYIEPGGGLMGARRATCAEAGCRGWVPKDWHLEDLLGLKGLLLGQYRAMLDAVAFAITQEADVLKAAERALLAALPK